MGHAGRGQRPGRGLGRAACPARHAGSSYSSARGHGSFRIRGPNGELSGGSGHQRTPCRRRVADRRSRTGRRLPGAHRDPGSAGAHIPGWRSPRTWRECFQHGARRGGSGVSFVPAMGVPAMGAKLSVGRDFRRRGAQRNDQRMPGARTTPDFGRANGGRRFVGVTGTLHDQRAHGRGHHRRSSPRHRAIESGVGRRCAAGIFTGYGSGRPRRADSGCRRHADRPGCT